MTLVNTLLGKFSQKFHESITCELTNELCSGTLPDYKLYTYLVQDLKFFQLGLNLFGNALVLCDDPKSAIVLGKQVGFLSNDENTYFHQCLEQLRSESLEEIERNVPSMLQDPPTLPEVQKYLDFMSYLTFQSRSYAEIITSMFVMEKVYLGWAEYHLQNTPATKKLSYKHDEWVKLHSGPDFSKWVDFLASEVNRVGGNEKAACEEYFERALDLEIDFFRACYSYEEK